MSKRNTFNAGSAAYYIRGPLIEAAKNLHNVTRRFVAGKANAIDVEQAIVAWKATLDAGAR